MKILMKPILSVITLFLFISVFNCQPFQKNGLTLVDIQVSTQSLNMSIVGESVTIDFTIQGSTSTPTSGITNGVLQFLTQFKNEYYTINWFRQNIISYDSSNDTVVFTVCAPVNLIGFCNVLGKSESLCQFNIEANHQPSGSFFSNQQISQNFPNSVITMYSSVELPILHSMAVTVNPQAPLVSFAFNAQQFSQSWYEIVVDFNSNKGQDLSLSVSNLVSSNGWYYTELLLIPEVQGFDYVVTSVMLIDFAHNTLTIPQNVLKNKYNVSSFTLPKSSTPFVQGLYQFNKPTSHSGSSSEYNLYIFDLYLANPTIELSLIYGLCTSFYQNSTYVQVYCTIPPFQSNEEKDIFITGFNSIEDLNQRFNVLYTNPSKKLPIITNTSLSLNIAPQLEPIYLEVNFTYQCFNAYFSSMQYSLAGSYQFDGIIFPSGISSGGITNGTATGYFLFDSAGMNLAQFNVILQDSKGSTLMITEKGIPYTPREFSNKLNFELIMGNTNLDFTNTSGFISLPVIFRTTSKVGTWLTSSIIAYVTDMGIDEPIQCGTTNFVFGNGAGVIQSNITSDGYMETEYQSYALIDSNQVYGYGIGGDILLSFTYRFGGEVTPNTIIYTKQCINIVTPQPQYTTVIDFSTNVTFPVNSTEVSSISFLLTTKGEPVSAASINPYLNSVEDLTYSGSPYVCSLVGPLSYGYPVITVFECTIPISNLPTQISPFYIDLIVNGITFTVYNTQLQDFGFPSVLNLVGPTNENGEVPQITSFQTVFDATTNTIHVNYTYSSPSHIPVTQVDFVVFNRPIYYATNGLMDTITFVDWFSTPGYFQITINQDNGFDYSWQSLGFYLSIPTLLNDIKYQFPYEYLITIDNNKMNFPINMDIADYSGPRLIELGIVSYQDYYYTNDQSYDIQIFFDITDDKSGLFEINGYIESSGSGNFLNTFILSSDESRVSGNNNNGRFVYNFTIPQYSNGNFSIQVTSLVDFASNQRNFTNQNLQFLYLNPYWFMTYSEAVDPNLPTLLNLSSVYNPNVWLNTIEISFSGLVSSITLLPNANGFFNTAYNFSPVNAIGQSPYIVDIVNAPNSVPATYTFSICISSQALAVQCFSWYDLENLGLPNSIYV